ncbi:MAG: type III secretion system stalk subunit SctO, partial [Thermodesulforhabdaceae bacterium]|jgi:type III secretion protein O
MHYALEDLLRIRRIREDRAEREVTSRRAAVDAATQFVARCQENLKAYRQWRLKEEDRLFNEIMERLVHLSDVEELRIQIADLRNEELVKEREVEEARKKLLEAQQRLQEARALHRKSVQARQKIEEHRKIWAVEAKRLEEQISDKEMEEFTSERLREHENLDGGL